MKLMTVGIKFRSWRIAVLTAFIVACAVSTTLVRAAIIDWNSPVTITNDLDASTNGNLVYACGDSGTAAMVNRVSFAGSFSGSVSVSGSAGSVGSSFAGGTSAPWSGLSTNYQMVLEGGIYANANTAMTVSLNNLNAGHNYLVQLWVNDSRSGGTTGRTETVTSSGGNTVSLAYNYTQVQGGVGQYAIGTFTADAATQLFTLTGVLPSGANSSQINAVQVRDVTPASAQIPAFPGAEGYGATASGGRGGTVYHVTTLADSGAGSLRDAVTQPNRTIVFDVGGLITLQSDLMVTNSNLTIAGQTAPGQGIGIYGNGNFAVKLYNQIGTNVLGTNYWLCPGSTNIIIRYLRFREGYNASFGNWSLALIDSKFIMLDHCSIELGCWQTMCMTIDPWAPPNYPSDTVMNVTMQNCICGASIGNQLGCLLWAPTNISISHTLWIDNGGRDPKVWGNDQIINDVLYNPQLGIYGAGAEQVDFIGNYHITGPSFTATGNDGIYIDASQGSGSFFYYTNNLLDSNLNGKLDGGPLGTNSNFNPVTISATPYCNPSIPVTIDSPTLAYYKVASQAGASLARDTIDNKLISELLSLGTQGQHYTNESQFGPMVIAGGQTPQDSDQDGMPDEWEMVNGSDYTTADNNVVDANGYTKLENYLNWMAAPHFKTYKNISAPDYDLWPLTMAFTNQTPAYSVFNPTNGTVTLISNRWARFVQPVNFTGLGSFTFSVTAADGTKLTNLVGVLVSPIAPATNLVWRGDAVANSWNLYLTNDWFNGTTLQPFNGDDSVTFDDTGSNSLPISLAGQLSPATISVNATKNYTFGGSGSLVGNFTLTKTNTGTLFIPNANSLFSGSLVVNGGMVVITNNTSAAGTGLISLNNGSLFSGPIANTISNAGTSTWSITGTGNVSPSSYIVGGGKIYVNPTNTSIFTPSGDWSGFAGTVTLIGNNPQYRLYGSNLGSAAAAYDLGTAGNFFNRNGGITVQLGSLTGGAGTILSGATSGAAVTTYVIGALNTDSTFNGKITDGSNPAPTALVKVGAGAFTVTGTNTYSGGTTVSNGTLLVNRTTGSGTGTNFVNVYSGATLGGTGIISGPVSILAGGTLSPGNPTGTLTISNSLTLIAGSISSFGLGTNSDRVAVKGNLVLGGTLNVTNAGGLAAGTNTVFTYTGTLSGSLSFGAIPSGFKFVLATNVAGQVNLLVGKPVIAATSLVSTNFIFTGTGGLATSNYYVLTSTNIALPVASWTRLNTNVFDSSGRFAFTNAVVATNRNRFYLLQMP